MKSDTICACATAPGGALGIVRISGPAAHKALAAICHKEETLLSSSPRHFCRIFDGNEVLDEAVISIFNSPRSYTGEDCAEVSCHGSTYILQRLLELLTEEGCRMADPGEFTRRAFMNGKLDLSQAEAVADLISARSKSAHAAAISQLRGHYQNELQDLRNRMLHLTSLLELELDFSDHEDLEFADRNELLSLCNDIDSRLSRLIKSFKTGQALKEGIPVAIAGETNVGKSTLLNCLLHEDRAIVSPVPGTTRDAIEGTTDIGGVTFRFTDTAGLRETDDTIERIGISRTRDFIGRAAIIVWVTDCRPSNSQLKEIKELCGDKPVLYVQNKTDIDPTRIPWACPMYFISAKLGIGIDTLEQAIFDAASLTELKNGEAIVTSPRHYDALRRARNDLQRAITALRNGLSGDLIAEDLRLVLNGLAEITGGAITPQETLNNIFSHFCIGK